MKITYGKGKLDRHFLLFPSVSVWMGGGFEDGSLPLESCVNPQIFLMWLCDLLLEAGVSFLLIVGDHAACGRSGIALSYS